MGVGAWKSLHGRSSGHRYSASYLGRGAGKLPYLPRWIQVPSFGTSYNLLELRIDGPTCLILLDVARFKLTSAAVATN